MITLNKSKLYILYYVQLAFIYLFARRNFIPMILLIINRFSFINFQRGIHHEHNESH